MTFDCGESLTALPLIRSIVWFGFVISWTIPLAL